MPDSATPPPSLEDRPGNHRIAASDFAHICGLDQVVVVMDRRTPAVEELCVANDIELIIVHA